MQKDWNGNVVLRLAGKDCVGCHCEELHICLNTRLTIGLPVTKIMVSGFYIPHNYIAQ